MSQQIQITGGAKVRNLEGVLTGTSGVVNSLGINVPSGIPQLDGSGKILVSQLPNSVMEFKGTWSAATNTPTLVNGTGNAGDVYLCNAAGTVNFGAGPIEFFDGDQVIYSGTIWDRASGATGTVTSVAVTESGDALTITGSPITTAGTINIGFAGTSGQYVNGAGGLTTFPTLSGYVPYTGATQNVDLGVYNIELGAVLTNKTANGGLLMKQNTIISAEVSGTNYTSIKPFDTRYLYFDFGQPSSYKSFRIDANGLTNATLRTYTLPDVSGTIALTSDLGAYLPLTGGTLTGKLTINTGGTDNQLQLNGTAPSLRLTNAVTGATINGFIAMAGTAGDYILTSAVGDMCIGNQNSGKIMFGFGSGTANPKMTIDASGNGVFSGTISATGGTLTGALSGTSATFSGNLTLSALTTGYLTKVGASGVITFSKLYENSFGGIQINNTETNGAQYYTTRLGPRGNNDGVSSTWYIPSNAAPTIGWGTAATSSAFTISTLADDITRLYVGNTGNIGIGTTNPTGAAGLALVLNSGASQGRICIKTSATGDASGDGLQIGMAGLDAFIEQRENAALSFATNATERMRITSAGKLLVRTTTSTAVAGGDRVIELDGNIYSKGTDAGYFWTDRSNASNFYGWYTTSNTIYLFNGTANAASINPSTGIYTPLSDINKKKDFEDSTIGLNAILGLKPTLYRMKTDDENAQKQLGFIAQEVKEFIPQAYIQTKGEKEDFIGLDDRPIIAALVKAIQEQQAQIEELKALIAAK